MKIIIELKLGKISLKLEDSQHCIDELVFAEDQNISENLWPFIDDLLKKNGSAVEAIERMEVDSDLEDTYTSRRIAEAAANTFNWIRQGKM